MDQTVIVLYHANYFTPAVMSATVLGILIYLVYFINVFEASKLSRTTTLLVTLYILSAIAFAVISYDRYKLGTVLLVSEVSFVFVSMALTAYLWFAFTRSFAILKQRYSKVLLYQIKVVLYFTLLFAMFPLLQIVVNCSLGTARSDIIFVGTVLSGTTTCIMDTFFVITFRQFIQRLSVEMDGIIGEEWDKHKSNYAIIAKYGIISSFFGIVTLIVIPAQL
ncbi:hypothetical protein BCR33DRAFT_854204 [Rhizoclosmatium globosum]|uniref:Uncharacterized protein n=1 Tax=Rhizoclosmatium globosum TaxID=329046 RepID=A0A1Y2BTZ8_9FUNG|nr:hypothetical protein BCR33DRAFT_854204 [Rhizoclosmatium globosum]|eukprot:ORY38240.1 hypothetical protein BCR33DRAFT_854204 [Rhizoclosmatium globosum]